MLLTTRQNSSVGWAARVVRNRGGVGAELNRLKLCAMRVQARNGFGRGMHDQGAGALQTGRIDYQRQRLSRVEKLMREKDLVDAAERPGTEQFGRRPGRGHAWSLTGID